MSVQPTRGGILALDLASRTGWAYGPATARLRRPEAFGYWQLGSASVHLARPWADLGDMLAPALDLYKPSLVVMEAPLPPSAHKHTRTARLLLGYCTVAELVCYRRKIQCKEQDASTVRKRLIGKGRPSKEEIVDWCRARGLEIHDHNAADAVVLWYFAAALAS
jgi:Holliday junction resolvasome RuvABC endonuclease subunit